MTTPATTIKRFTKGTFYIGQDKAFYKCTVARKFKCLGRDCYEFEYYYWPVGGEDIKFEDITKPAEFFVRKATKKDIADWNKANQNERDAIAETHEQTKKEILAMPRTSTKETKTMKKTTTKPAKKTAARKPAAKKATPKAKAKATPKKPAAAKKAKAKPAAKKATVAKTTTDKKLSQLDAAAIVLGDSSEPLKVKEIVNEMASQNLWSSPGGKTPERTLYSAIAREIKTKGGESRFKLVDKGTFGLA